LINYKGISTTVLTAIATFFIVMFILRPIPQIPLSANEVHVKRLSTIMNGTIDRSFINYELLVRVNRGYSNDDVTCMARNIYFEARNESLLGQHAVAWVTINRKKHHKWPNTICKVVYQRKQFSWTIRGRYAKTYNKSAYERAILIAKDSLEEAHNGGEDLSNGALYYHADYVKPYWRKKLVRLAQIETHIFYK